MHREAIALAFVWPFLNSWRRRTIQRMRRERSRWPRWKVRQAIRRHLGSQFIVTADDFRIMHDYQLSQTCLERAKAASAPDTEVRIGLDNNYLALGDTARAQAELAAVSFVADSAPDYQYLLAEANVLRQQHRHAQALTSFAQASNAEGDDQSAEQAMLQAGANGGLRVTPPVSVLSVLSVDPIYEDSTVYVLDSKLDATFRICASWRLVTGALISASRRW